MVSIICYTLHWRIKSSDTMYLCALCRKGFVMPLVEAVTIELGSAIAKSILKTWLKDSSLGEDISSSLIDLLKTRTTDMLAQRRGQRQFERIGEMVGENLLPIFEREGAGLDDNSKTA